MGLRTVLKTELPHLAGGGADHSCSGKAMKLLPGKNNRSDYLAHTDRKFFRSQLQLALWAEGTK
jgi:hypothetical protein